MGKRKIFVTTFLSVKNDNKKTICSIYKRNKSFLNLPVHNGMEFLNLFREVFCLFGQVRVSSKRRVNLFL
jgi:hypothetical protein